MCRWLAYTGPAVALSSMLTSPDHSLIDQSQNARESVVSTNGDGFGIGWYGKGNTAGCFRDTHPAWNDENLKQLALHIHSPLFLAHVRAATGTPVQRTNCHPFTFENWLFQHNGSVPAFKKVKRRLLFDVAPELFPYIEGSTDSELLFFLALTFGLRDHPQTALERTIGHVEQVLHEAGINRSLDFSAALSDGRRLFAVRYATDGHAPTVYHSSDLHALSDLDDSYGDLPVGSVIVVSEPLDEMSENWQQVPESTLLTAETGQVSLSPFVPGQG